MAAGTLTSPIPREQRELGKAMPARLPEFADRRAVLLSEQDEFYRRVNKTPPRRTAPCAGPTSNAR